MRRHDNCGEVALVHKRRKSDPMRAYDALPPDLRKWMSQAVLPWSPVSCLKIWSGSDGPADALRRLENAERKTLEKARCAEK